MTHQPLVRIRGSNGEIRPAIIAGAGILMIRATGAHALGLYRIYAPPERKNGIVQSTKPEAEARHKAGEWDGKTRE